MTDGIKKRSFGFTLTELAIVLSIIGGMLGAIWSAASMVHQNQMTTQAESQILIIVSNVRSVMGARKSFVNTGNQSNAMANSGVFPNEMLLPGGITYVTTGASLPSVSSPAVDPWGAPVVIWTAMSQFGDSPSTFRVSYYNVPSAACTKIVSTAIGNLGQNGPTVLTTQCGSVTVFLQDNTDAVAVANACAANTPTVCRSMELDFDLNQ